MTDETSLTRRRRALTREAGLLKRILLIEGIAAAVLLLGGFLYFWKTGGSGPLWVAGILALVAFGHWMKSRENMGQAGLLDVGMSGEAEVTRELADYLDARFYIFNDIMIRHGRRSAQIDHLVVSPLGLFVIETKNWSGRIEGHAVDKVWKQIRRDGQAPRMLKNPMDQNRGHVEVLKGFRAGKGIPEVEMISLLVNRNPRARFLIEDMPMPILEPAETGETIARYRPKNQLTEETVDRIVAVLMEAS